MAYDRIRYSQRGKVMPGGLAWERNIYFGVLYSRVGNVYIIVDCDITDEHPYLNEKVKGMIWSKQYFRYWWVKKNVECQFTPSVASCSPN